MTFNRSTVNCLSLSLSPHQKSNKITSTMPLCNACTLFFRTAFVPPKQKEEYVGRKKQVPHLRMPYIFESATKCEVCAMIKTCSMRTFHELLEEYTDGAFLRFMADNFPDEQITLTLDRVYNDETAPRSRAVRVCLPDPSSNVPELRRAYQDINLSLWATVGTSHFPSVGCSPKIC